MNVSYLFYSYAAFSFCELWMAESFSPQNVPPMKTKEQYQNNHLHIVLKLNKKDFYCVRIH